MSVSEASISVFLSYVLLYGYDGLCNQVFGAIMGYVRGGHAGIDDDAAGGAAARSRSSPKQNFRLQSVSLASVPGQNAIQIHSCSHWTRLVLRGFCTFCVRARCIHLVTLLCQSSPPPIRWTS